MMGLLLARAGDVAAHLEVASNIYLATHLQKKALRLMSTGNGILLLPNKPPSHRDLTERADAMRATEPTFRIGADVGGTFTDVILLSATGALWSHKLPSTPPHFEEAVLQGIDQVLRTAGIGGTPVTAVAHGTTVATNAVLEQRGARTALITTGGFRDVLELRRIRAPQLYDLFFDKPAPLVERYLRFELSERMAADGAVVRPVTEAELWTLKEKLVKADVEAVAVCLLHAYAYPAHEVQVGAFLRQELPHLHISLSSEVLRERREYERTATTVVNAYVQPVMQRYLHQLRSRLHDHGIRAPLLIMQSAGGLAPETEAVQRPVYALESGPAAGVLAANALAQRLHQPNIIAFDMGGTTAKAAMIEGGVLAYSAEYEVGSSLSVSNRLVGGGGELIRAPTIDIAEVGAGGGSLAYLDRAGGLRVGPQSAGARPGPVCYGRGGTQPTVTDANVVLGYIRPGPLADGDVIVDRASAQRAIDDQIAQPLGLNLLQAAEGIHQIANARMMRALRAVSTERGRDPRDFALIAFGGSGPVHAAGLARELAIGQIIIPPLPGLFSALGLLFSGIEHHDVRSCALSGASLTAVALAELIAEMQTPMLAQFAAEGVAAGDVHFSSSVDMRFRGQASEIQITYQADMPLSALIATFEQEHEQLYGHRSDPDNPVEVVAVRLVGRTAAPEIQRLGETSKSTTTHPRGQVITRPAYFGAEGGLIDTPVLTRRDLMERVAGPLLIDEYDSTIVVPPGMQAKLDRQGNIEITQI